MNKIASRSEKPSESVRELTAGELALVSGGTILQVNGGGNTPLLAVDLKGASEALTQ